MEIALVAATPFEIAPVFGYLQQEFECPDGRTFRRGKLGITPLITGVGIHATAFTLGGFLVKSRPDLCINAGIGGALDRNLQIGEVIAVRTERFADLGVENADGTFSDLFELGLIDEQHTPIFQNGVMHNPQTAASAFLPSKNGITVNKVHGFEPSIEALRVKYPDAEIESMEGAAFFYACLTAKIPFMELRSISNYVEKRNRDAWNLPLAIGNLNVVLKEMIEMLGESIPGN